MDNQSDIAIVGGGIVGNLIARGIQHHTDLSVRMFAAEQITAQPSPTGLDARVIALAKRSVDELCALNCDFSKLHATPIQTIQVTDKGHLGFSELHAKDFNLPEFGRVVSVHQLGLQLHDTILQQSLSHQKRASQNFSLVAPTRVTQVQQFDDHVALSTRDGKTYRAKLLIMADGGGNDYAQKLGFTFQHKDYQQHAIITNITTDRPHNNIAYERFTNAGPVALLPYVTSEQNSDNATSFSVVWTCTPEQAEELLTLDSSAFIRQLQTTMGWRQGKITTMSQPLSYPLALRWAPHPVTHRCVAVGNAAQTLHPIAGQGFNLGLRDAMTLVTCLKSCQDPGNFSTLNDYKIRRQQDRKQTISLTDTLVHVFANDYFSTTIGRNLALAALDNCSLAKNAFVRRTTGLAYKFN